MNWTMQHVIRMSECFFVIDLSEILKIFTNFNVN